MNQLIQIVTGHMPWSLGADECYANIVVWSNWVGETRRFAIGFDLGPIEE
ncbi:hypothetical protein [Dubosiella newyorkensis]